MAPCPSYPVLMATMISCSARDELADEVADRQRPREADDGALADEVGRLVERLIERGATLLQHLLCVFRVEVAENLACGALTVRVRGFACHGSPSVGAT